MNLHPEPHERILEKLKAEHRDGSLKNRTDSILVFAELTKAGITEEEFRAVRGFLSRVLRHSRAVNRALQQGDKQIAEIKGALSSKPAPTPSEIRSQIGSLWLVHEETAFLEAVKEELEAETLRLKEKSEILKESISMYHDLMDAWADFSGWTASPKG